MQEIPTVQQPIPPQQPPMYRPPYMSPPPYQPPPKPSRSRKWLWLIIGLSIALLLFVGFDLLLLLPQNNGLQAPGSTQSPALTEGEFKSSTKATTIAMLDKQGNNYKGTYVTFTCTLSSFVKDSDGYTVGANVTDPNSSGVIQIAFPAGIDLEKMNRGDTLKVWGIDAGVFSGPNAFGATVQEVGVVAMYITDQTTGYATH